MAGATTPATPGKKQPPAREDIPGPQPATVIHIEAAAATGEEAALLDEARRRLAAGVDLLGYAAVGLVDPGEVLDGSIRLLDQAGRLVERAGE